VRDFDGLDVAIASSLTTPVSLTSRPSSNETKLRTSGADNFCDTSEILRTFPQVFCSVRAGSRRFAPVRETVAVDKELENGGAKYISEEAGRCQQIAAVTDGMKDAQPAPPMNEGELWLPWGRCCSPLLKSASGYTSKKPDCTNSAPLVNSTGSPVSLEKDSSSKATLRLSFSATAAQQKAIRRLLQKRTSLSKNKRPTRWMLVWSGKKIVVLGDKQREKKILEVDDAHIEEVIELSKDDPDVDVEAYLLGCIENE